MLAEHVQSFALPEEKLTVPELGGDGAVVVRGIGFGRKMFLATEAPKSDAASMLAADSVVDERGKQLMTAAEWDKFAMLHEEAFLNILAAAKRVSGFDSAEVKKD